MTEKNRSFKDPKPHHAQSAQSRYLSWTEHGIIALIHIFNMAGVERICNKITSEVELHLQREKEATPSRKLQLVATVANEIIYQNREPRANQGASIVAMMVIEAKIYLISVGRCHAWRIHNNQDKNQVELLSKESQGYLGQSPTTFTEPAVAEYDLSANARIVLTTGRIKKEHVEAATQMHSKKLMQELHRLSGQEAVAVWGKNVRPARVIQLLILAVVVGLIGVVLWNLQSTAPAIAAQTATAQAATAQAATTQTATAQAATTQTAMAQTATTQTATARAITVTTTPTTVRPPTSTPTDTPSPTPTRPTSTSTPVTSEPTQTAVPTNTSTPIPVHECIKSDPPEVQLLSPGDNDIISEQSEFRWKTAIEPESHQAFELVFWQKSEDPCENGEGLADGWRGTIKEEKYYVNKKVDFVAADQPQGDYLWGILLVEKEQDGQIYKRLRYLGEESQFTYNPPRSGSSSGSQSCPKGKIWNIQKQKCEPK